VRATSVGPALCEFVTRATNSDAGRLDSSDSKSKETCSKAALVLKLGGLVAGLIGDDPVWKA
jgi:hypothetical protein